MRAASKMISHGGVEYVGLEKQYAGLVLVSNL